MAKWRRRIADYGPSVLSGCFSAWTFALLNQGVERLVDLSHLTSTIQYGEARISQGALMASVCLFVLGVSIRARTGRPSLFYSVFIAIMLVSALIVAAPTFGIVEHRWPELHWRGWTGLMSSCLAATAFFVLGPWFENACARFAGRFGPVLSEVLLSIAACYVFVLCYYLSQSSAVAAKYGGPPVSKWILWTVLGFAFIAGVAAQRLGARHWPKAAFNPVSQ